MYKLARIRQQVGRNAVTHGWHFGRVFTNHDRVMEKLARITLIELSSAPQRRHPDDGG